VGGGIAEVHFLYFRNKADVKFIYIYTSLQRLACVTELVFPRRERGSGGYIARWRNWLSQQIHNLQVGGSSPSLATNLFGEVVIHQ
jgi:hypothetical protein